MKKIAPFTLAFFIISGLLLISCKKNDFNKLEYLNISKKKFLQAHVKKKGGELVLWFQVFDQSAGKTDFNKIQEKMVKIDNYTAKIKENQWIALLVNNRFEIRLFAYTASKDFQDTGELKRFIKLFDLAGMEQVTGPTLKPDELEKFIPKLGGK